MATIRPRPSKGERKDRPTTWQIIYSLPKKSGEKGYEREYETFFGTKSEAQDHAQAHEAEIKTKGKHYVRPSKVLLSECTDKWYKNHVLSDLKAKTQRSYEQNLRLYIVPHLGHLPLSELTPQILSDWTSMLARPKSDGGHGLGPRSVELAMTTLNQVLNEQYRLGVVTENPLDRVQRPKQKPRVVVPYELDDLRKIEEATEGSRLRYFFRFLWHTGLRISEAIPLIWEDVDLDRQTMRVSRNLEDVKGKRIIDVPKSRAGLREIALASQTVELLRQQRALIDGEKHPRGWTDTDLVFPSLVGTPLYQSNVDKAWDAIKAKAGVADYGLHSLRHTSASLLVLAEVGMREISANLGHSNPGFTARTYAHLLQETRRLTARKLEGLLEAEEERRVKPASPGEPV